MNLQSIILGAGMTGLAAGLVSGLPIYEAAEIPGGICASYYLQPGTKERLFTQPEDGEAYRFELGGGHWIFGGDSSIRSLINQFTLLKEHVRHSSVYFHKDSLYVPYPLQNHLRYLGGELATRVLAEMAQPHNSFHTMREWLEACFGSTLCRHFFFPFHELYTAGLYTTIAPQDAYKSPVSLPLVIQGALQDVQAVGYNATFQYPESDLNTLARGMAANCKIQYGKRVTAIDVRNKQVTFADGTQRTYDRMISTLPLNAMLTLTNIHLDATPDPFTSVLVLNIGAVTGPACPNDHWLYNPDAVSGFHRVGFYSNIDRSFLPRSAQSDKSRVSIYVERAYPAGARQSDEAIRQYGEDVIRELHDWGYIDDVDVIDPTWIPVAYTWAYPDSSWKQEALQALEAHGIYQVGRYGRWRFQGIADSLRDGLMVGASLKQYHAS